MQSTFSMFVKYVSSNVLGMIGISCYIFADTLFIAQGVGETGLTALNLAIPAFTVMHGIGLMLGIGGATRFSLTQKKDIFQKTLTCSLVISILLVLLGVFFSEPLAFLLGADAVTHSLTAVYVRILLCFSPAFLLNNLLSSFIRNDSAPQLVMCATIIGSLVNIVLDYILVFPMKLGIIGAALATGVSPLVSVFVLSLHFIRKRNTFHIGFLCPSAVHIKQMCALGSSALIAELSSGTVVIVFNYIILKLSGNTGVAAYSIIANVAMILSAIFNGVANGCQPIFSKAKFACDKMQTKICFRLGVVTCELLAILSIIVIFAFAHPITDVFNTAQNPQLTTLTVDGIRIYFLSFLFAGFNVFVSAFHAAVDRPAFAFSISLCRGFAIIIPCAFLFSFLFGMTGVWLSIVACECIVCLYSIYTVQTSK